MDFYSFSFNAAYPCFRSSEHFPEHWEYFFFPSSPTGIKIKVCEENICEEKKATEIQLNYGRKI